MKDLASTKLRLVREAVRDNAEGPFRTTRQRAETRPILTLLAERVFRARQRAEIRPRFTLLTVLMCSFLIGSLVYLSVPPPASLRVGVAAAHTAKPTPVIVAAAVDSPPAVARAPRPVAIRTIPQRPSRAVLPLSVRKIVL